MRIGVHDRAVLNIAVLADANGFDVAAQGGAEPDAGAFVQHHIANYVGIGRNKNPVSEVGFLLA